MDFQLHLRHFAVEQIESYLAINGGDLLELSPQQLTSCSPNELQCGGTGGCAGSIASLAFTYAQLFGSALEADYPYLSGERIMLVDRFQCKRASPTQARPDRPWSASRRRRCRPRRCAATRFSRATTTPP